MSKASKTRRFEQVGISPREQNEIKMRVKGAMDRLCGADHGSYRAGRPVRATKKAPR